MKLNVFGRIVKAEKVEGQWCVYYLGDGKRRPARDINIPPDIEERNVVQYIADLCHEWATPSAPEVKVLD